MISFGLRMQSYIKTGLSQPFPGTDIPLITGIRTEEIKKKILFRLPYSADMKYACISVSVFLKEASCTNT